MVHSNLRFLVVEIVSSWLVPVMHNRHHTLWTIYDNEMNLNFFYISITILSTLEDQLSKASFFNYNAGIAKIQHKKIPKIFV